MKPGVTCCLWILLIILWACQSKNKTGTSGFPEAESVRYDSIKAKQYGADDYGMKKYVMAFLKRGPNRDNLDSITAAELQKAHLENIFRMAGEGQLVLAGPFFGTGEIRGIYIFNVSSIQEAEELTNTDPAVKAGSLKMELLEWYGPAALMEVNERSKALMKKSILSGEG